MQSPRRVEAEVQRELPLTSDGGQLQVPPSAGVQCEWRLLRQCAGAHALPHRAQLQCSPQRDGWQGLRVVLHPGSSSVSNEQHQRDRPPPLPAGHRLCQVEVEADVRSSGTSLQVSQDDQRPTEGLHELHWQYHYCLVDESHREEPLHLCS